MKRISTLGLSAVLALALTASIGVASAGASGFVANGSPHYAHVTGTVIGTQVIKLAGTNWECTKADLDGEFDQATSSFGPTLAEKMTCGGGFRDIKTNGCKFIFHPGAETSPGVFGGTAEIGPPGCGPMTTTGVSGTTKIYPKAGLNATFTNVNAVNDTVTATIDTGGIKYLEPYSSGQIKENGTYNGSWTLKGDQLGTPVDLAVEADLPRPIALIDNGGVPAFEADSYPIGVHTATKSTAVAEWKFVGGLLTMKCNFIDYEFSLSGLSSDRSASAVHSGCKGGAFPAKVESNGCQYRFQMTNLWGGNEEIVCPEGKAITMNVYPSKAAEEEGKASCRVELGSQSKGTISNAGSSFGFVTMDTAMSGLKYTYTRLNALCPGSGGGGTFENGSFTHQVKLVGFE